jgi:hypothetical protein
MARSAMATMRRWKSAASARMRPRQPAPAVPGSAPSTRTVPPSSWTKLLTVI